jgi:hypothetical protein
VNHVDGKVSPPASRFAMMNGGTSMASIVAGSVSLPSTPQVVQQQQQALSSSASSSSASGISGSTTGVGGGGGTNGPSANSNVVRQLFQQAQPASSTPGSSKTSISYPRTLFVFTL